MTGNFFMSESILRKIFSVVDELTVESLRNGFVGQVAVNGVETFGKPRVLLASRLPTFARNL